MSNVGLKKINKKSHSPEETKQIGQALAKELPSQSIVCFFGDLGAGKTTFIKAVASELTGINPHKVSSPTFTYLHIYDGKTPVFHFDLYRLQNHEEFFKRGFDEYFEAEGVCCIEWAEHIQAILPKRSLYIKIGHLGANNREISIL